MAETYAGRLDPDGGVMLQRIQQAAVRMQALLSDVVDYWAAGPDECQFSRTDMDAVLRQALLCTDSLILERGAVVTHDSLPAVAGDFAALSKVMHHLLRNAIAYGNASTPHVHISSRWVDPQWEISVRDDGPGIDPEFHARVFSVFKRLHGPERPGNGLGLAFCKKAIEAHGGHIWVESASGAGAAFFFTLPPPD
jgi:light-regulated signal transduction histidine kinase (bacteriophytochrome)